MIKEDPKSSGLNMSYLSSIIVVLFSIFSIEFRLFLIVLKGFYNGSSFLRLIIFIKSYYG